jgi:hypothetical protein
MAATATRRRLTEVERAERVEALTAELAAVAALTDSAGWRSMLEVSARFRRYSLNNQLLLWAQATQRGMTLTRVAAFGTWRKLGYRVRAGEKGLRIFGPVTRRLRADEVASWLVQGREPCACSPGRTGAARSAGITYSPRTSPHSPLTNGNAGG